MKALLFTFLVFYSFITASGQDAEKIKELELRVLRLEERLAKLEKNAARSQSTPEVKKMMEIAAKHDEAQRKTFKEADIAKAEELYQKAARMLAKEESKAILDSVVSLYPQLNRAGCAQLYRAQQETGREKERLLKDCMERFAECYYFDGAQVGSLAMFQLAFFYRKTGREDEAHKLFKRIRRESPDAVDHNGALLVDEID